MRNLLFLVLIVVMAGSVFVSGQCKLPVDKAPKLRGVSLGMTSDEVITLFGKPFSQDAESISYLDSWPDMSGTDLKFHKPSNFEGVRRLGVVLAENRVSQVMITYKDVEWSSAKEFAEALSDKLVLPLAWTITGEKARMECQSWTITADARNNDIVMVDQAPILKKIREDEKKSADKKKVFKP